MSTASTQPTTFSGLISRAVHGALAGIAGGIVFGMLMAMMGMLTTIAGMVGSNSAAVGGLIHLMISAGIGSLFAVIVAARKLGVLLGGGAVYGMAWWVLGPLVLMPTMMGMPLFMINQTALMSLMGHVIYGLVTAAALFGIRRRAHA